MREVGRFEGHGDAELGQAIGQRRAAFIEQMSGLGPFGLQPPLHAMQRGEVAQMLRVNRRQRLQVAQHQRGDAVARGEFDLWQSFALFHAADQLAQRHQQGTHFGRQHGAQLHVGHVAALALVKADQHGAFLDDMPHAQTRAAPVAPGRAFDGPQHALCLDLRKVPQVVFQHALLHRHLCRGVQVLHLAAAARPRVQAEVLATRAHALRAFARDGRDLALLPLVLLACHIHLHTLGGQGAFNEHHLAVGAVRHALGFEVQRLHLQPFVSTAHR